MEDIKELFEEFLRYGYVTRSCPECKGECSPTEIDNPEAYCEICDKTVNVGRVL